MPAAQTRERNPKKKQLKHPFKKSKRTVRDPAPVKGGQTKVEPRKEGGGERGAVRSPQKTNKRMPQLRGEKSSPSFGVARV